MLFRSDYNSLSAAPVNQGVIDGTGTGMMIGAGYLFNQYFALEAGYHDYGNPTAMSQNQNSSQIGDCPGSFSCPHITAFTLEAAGRYEIVPDLTGELLGGVQEWHAGAPAESLLGKSNGALFVYGLRFSHGLDDMVQGLSVDIAYEHSAFSISETRIGLHYNF